MSRSPDHTGLSLWQWIVTVTHSYANISNFGCGVIWSISLWWWIIFPLSLYTRLFHILPSYIIYPSLTLSHSFLSFVSPSSAPSITPLPSPVSSVDGCQPVVPLWQTVPSPHSPNTFYVCTQRSIGLLIVFFTWYCDVLECKLLWN